MPEPYQEDTSEDLGNSKAKPKSQTSPNEVSEMNDLFFNMEEKSFEESSYRVDSTIKPYNPDELVQRANDYSIYEDMLKDDQINVALQLKKDLVLSAGSEIIANGDDEESIEIQKFLEDALYKYPEIPLDESLEEILTAYEFGFSLTEKIFKKKDDGKICLKFLKTRHPATWLIHTDPKGNVTRYEQRGANTTVDIDPKALIHYQNNSRFGNPYGTSDLRAAYSAYFTKRQIVKYYAIFLEKSASPIPVARYNKDAPQSAVDAIFNAMKSFQQKTALAIPKDIEVEFLKSDNNGDAYKHAINIFNMFIGRALFIPDLLGFQGSETSGGSYSLGKEQMDVLFKHINKRRSELEKMINKEIIKPLVYVNFGEVESCPEWKLKPVRESEMLELVKIWIDAAKSNIVTPNLEQENYINKLCKMPEMSEEEMEERQAMADAIATQTNGQPGMPQVDEEGKPIKGNPCGAGMRLDESTGECVPEDPEDSAKVGKEKPKGKCPPGQRLDPRSGECIPTGRFTEENPSESYVTTENTQQQESQLAIDSRKDHSPCECKKKEFKEQIKQLDYDNKVDFKKIESSLDAFLNGALDSTRPLVNDAIKSIKDQIKRKKILETQNLDKVDTIKLKNKSALEKELMKGFKQQFEDAQIIAQNELFGTQNVTAKKFTQPLLDEDFLEVLESETWQTIGDWEYKIKQDLRVKLATAIKDGSPLSVILDGLDVDGKQLTEEQITRYARTKFTEVMNRGRHKVFEESGIVEAYQYSAILDGRTSEICRGLDGKIFPKGKEPIPPLHFNCRSLLVPVTKYEQWEASTKVGSKTIEQFMEDNTGEGF